MAVQSTAAAASQLYNTVNGALSLAMSATPGASAKFSITVWIKANWGTTGAVTGRTSMVGLYGPSPNPTTALQIGSTTGAGELSCWTWGGNVLVGSGTNYMTAYNNQWIHVGYTYDGTNHLLYLNGVLIFSSTVAQLAGNMQMVCINGYPSGTASETWNHIVDAYRLYNRVLAPNEILTMYNAQGSRHSIEYGLIAGYEFDEGIEASNVSQCLDQSGNAIHLPVVGAGAAPKYVYGTTYAGSNVRPVTVT